MSYDDDAVNKQKIMDRLSVLLGTWKGTGGGKFPTIQSFQYTEELIFRSNGIEPVIHFEQKTWLLSNDEKNGSPLHWESGFFKVRDDGKIEILNAQNSGRVEVLIGAIRDEPKGSHVLHLSFESALLGHDSRMVRSARTFSVEANLLKYTVGMATVKTPEFQQHLEASLLKVIL